MPLDKQHNSAAKKPFTPTLSSNFRATKSPITPKLAGAAPNSRSTSPRRPLHTESPLLSQPKEEISTPVSSFLTSNITPRSGSRKSRIGTDSPTTATSTPSGTPTSSRPASIIGSSARGPIQTYGAAGLGISSLESRLNQAQRPNSVVGEVNGSLLAARPDFSDGNRALREATVSPKFFRAGDAQSTVSSPDAEEKPPPKAKAATFFYASDASSLSPKLPTAQSESNLVLQESKPKFFHANASATFRAPIAKPFAASKFSPASSRQPSPDVQKRPQRPPSPLKQASTKSAPIVSTNQPARRSSIASIASRRQQEPKSKQQDDSLARRISNSSASSAMRHTTHRKSASIASPQSTPTKKLALRISPKASPKIAFADDNLQQLTASPVLSPRTASLGSANTMFSEQTTSSNQSISGLQSPTRSAEPSVISSDTSQPTKLQQMNELAAKARRERKVLDLEISNSSLLAINRTLEREMRKQNAELRRFRRLSRAGRLSMAPGSVRSVSGFSAMEGFDHEVGDLSSLSEGLSSGNDDEEEDDELDSSFGEDDDLNGALSPTTQAVQDAKHRARDEKRLLLDLSKHQQMLIDSQKMNQSIKRCTNWTDELIAEGKKALAYQVKVSDVELGGRVLIDEDHHEMESRRGLLSPSATIGSLEVESMWDRGIEAMAAVVETMDAVGVGESQPP